MSRSHARSQTTSKESAKEQSKSKFKRGHDEAMCSMSDGDMSVSDSDNEGNFEEFLSRYTKRLRRQQKSQESGLHAGSIQSLSQPITHHAPNHGSSRRCEGQQLEQEHAQPGKSRSQLYDEAIDAAISHTDNRSTDRTFISGDDLNVLRATVQHMQDQINALTNQVEFLLSTADNTNVNAAIPASTTYASVTARSRNAMLAAVHTDLKLKQSRQSHIVVSGLPYKDKDEFADEQLFSELCWVEFGVTPVVMHTKRLGTKVETKLQPVLIVLQEIEQAQLLLSLAKLLRNSSDSYTANSVFLSPHQTQAERQAEYETRCRRRELHSNRASQHNQERSQQGHQDRAHQPCDDRGPGPASATNTSSIAGRRGGTSSSSSNNQRVVTAAIAASASRPNIAKNRTVSKSRSSLTQGTLPTSAVPAMSSSAIVPSGTSNSFGSDFDKLVQLVISRLPKSVETSSVSNSTMDATVAPFQPTASTGSPVDPTAGPLNQ